MQVCQGWWTVRECPGLSRLAGNTGLLGHSCSRGGGPSGSVPDCPYYPISECPRLSKLPWSTGLLRHRCARGDGQSGSVPDCPGEY